ncbi:hypothetical protein BDF19DRAFT_9790 [Syncephalis fuscata]|nr:hypothetical protein BDF19DRAFT_9790 [Syncephalis fuscata]
MLNSLIIFAILPCFVVSVFGMATFHMGNRTFQYHTQDLFEFEVAPYTTRGILMEAVFNKNTTCEILPSIFDKARSALKNVKFHNITRLIIAIDAVKAHKCGCKTIAHTKIAVSKLNQHSNATNGFLVDTALYIAHKKPGPSFGAYRTLRYTGYGFGHYKDVSSVNIALLPYENYQVVLDARKKLKTAIIVTVKEEPGPWNAVFLSVGYRAFIYFIVAVVISIMMYSLVVLYCLLKVKRNITKQHVVIYASALCAAILFASALMLRENSIVHKWIMFFLGIFLYIGFYTLILLWHSIAVSVQKSRCLLLLRYAIIISFVIAIVGRILYIMCAFIPSPTAQGMVRIASNRFVLFTQFTIIIAFVYYGTTTILF